MKHQSNHLRYADGGEIIARWANRMVGNNPKAMAARGRSEEADAPAYVPPPEPAKPSLRFQDGGRVRGSGQGDKIPAMYEPGEFVVSNSMLDREPGLRGALRDLREDTLAAEGKTVAEVDAKAMGGPLRAAHGGDFWSKEASDFRAQTRTPGPMPQATPAAAASPRGNVFTRTGAGISGAGESVGRAGVRTAESIAEAGRAVGKQIGPALKVVGKSLASSSNPVGNTLGAFIPNASAFNDDRYDGWDKARLAGTVGLRGLGAIGGGLFVGGVGTAVGPVGTFAGGIGGASAGNYFGRKLGNAVFGTDKLLRDKGYDPDRDMFDVTGDVFRGKSGEELTGGQGPRSNSWGGEANRPEVGGGTVATPDVALAGNPAGSNQAAYDAMNADLSRYAQRQGTSPNTEDGVVTRVGNSFSGRNISGYEGKNPIGIVPGMRQADIDQALTNPDGSRWSAADNATMAANLRDGVNVYRGTSRQAGEDAQAEQGNLRRLALSPLGTPGRTPALKLLNEQSQNATLRAGQESAARTAERKGQRDAFESDRRNALDERRLDAEGARSDRTFNQQERTFNAGREDATLAQSQSADKAWIEHTSTLFRTVDAKGNDVPDANKIAAFTSATDQTIGQLMPKLLKSADPEERAYAKKLGKHGRAALDKEDLAEMQVLFERQQAHQGGLGDFWGPSGQTSSNLRDYRITGSDNGWMQRRVKTAGGQRIPEVNLEYGPNANHWGFNSGPGAKPTRLRGE